MAAAASRSWEAFSSTVNRPMRSRTRSLAGSLGLRNGKPCAMVILRSADYNRERKLVQIG